MKLEAKPPVELDNITQVTYGRAEDLPKALATTLRRDPDVILIDQCPDARTADMIIEASQEYGKENTG